MIGILGGMGTQAGLDFCNKLAVLNRGKLIKNIHYLYFIINQIFQVDLNLLVLKLKIFQINLQIKQVEQNITKF